MQAGNTCADIVEIFYAGIYACLEGGQFVCPCRGEVNHIVVNRDAASCNRAIFLKLGFKLGKLGGKFGVNHFAAAETA